MRVVRLCSALTMLMGCNRPCKQKLGGDATSIIASIGRSAIGMKSTIRTSMHFVIAARAESTARTTPSSSRMRGPRPRLLGKSAPHKRFAPGWVAVLVPMMEGQIAEGRMAIPCDDGGVRRNDGSGGWLHD